MYSNVCSPTIISSLASNSNVSGSSPDVCMKFTFVDPYARSSLYSLASWVGLYKVQNSLKRCPGPVPLSWCCVVYRSWFCP